MQVRVAATAGFLGASVEAGMSVRTLGRRLGEQGWTYDRLVEELRCSEISAFDRALRRHSQLSPLAFRRQLRTS